MGQAMAHVMANPAGILLVVLLTLASAAFHEVGHAAACRYGKVPPGAMGCGIYLVWPAFYTDVTNSYRLSKSGRLRTDLGGVYFNGLFIVGLFLLYVYTGSPLLLVTFLLVNLEMVQQLLPTLRFDGYYIVSDLVGIPDLFKYVGPILKRTILRFCSRTNGSTPSSVGPRSSSPSGSSRCCPRWRSNSALSSSSFRIWRPPPGRP